MPRTDHEKFLRTPPESIRTGHGDRGISRREPRDLSRSCALPSVLQRKLTRESRDAIAASRGTDVDARGCNSHRRSSQCSDVLRFSVSCCSWLFRPGLPRATRACRRSCGHKLSNTQALLKAIVTTDYKEIDRAAAALNRISEMEIVSWQNPPKRDTPSRRCCSCRRSTTFVEAS